MKAVSYPHLDVYKRQGGRFAQLCAPAQVFSIVLSDVLGNSLESIASGPAAPDSSTSEQALEVVKKYGLRLSSRALEILKEETPKTLENSETCLLYTSSLHRTKRCDRL